ECCPFTFGRWPWRYVVTILFLDQFGDLGGGQLSLLDLMPSMLVRGWKAHVALPEGGTFATVLKAIGVPVHLIPCGPYTRGYKTTADYIQFVTQLPLQTGAMTRLIRELEPDLLYVNGPRLMPAAALASRRRTPVLLHVYSRLRGPEAWLVQKAA